MKQVYFERKETETPSQTAYFRVWVLFLGFLVWLIAVNEAFGQSAKPAHSGSSGAYTASLNLPPAGADHTTKAVSTRKRAGRRGNKRRPGGKPSVRRKAEEAFSFGLKAFPNPSVSGVFTVSVREGLTGDVLVMVLDRQGRSLFSGVLEAGAGSRALEVDLLNKQPGKYMLYLRSGDKREVMELARQ